MANIFTPYCDKIAHIGLCAYSVVTLSLYFSLFCSVWITIILCILKELIDRYILKGKIDAGDLVADIIRIILGVIPRFFL